MYKNILVICGNEIVSSSIIASMVENYLKENMVKKGNIDKTSLMYCTDNKFNSYGLIVSSTKIENPSINTKVILAAGLLTSINDKEITALL